MRAVVEQTAYGEQLGFNSIWLAEHHFHSFGGIFSAPPVIGSAIAQRTNKIRVGTAVILLPYHNPLRMAEDYATLDCLERGQTPVWDRPWLCEMGGADVRNPPG